MTATTQRSVNDQVTRFRVHALKHFNWQYGDMYGHEKYLLKYLDGLIERDMLIQLKQKTKPRLHMEIRCVSEEAGKSF